MQLASAEVTILSRVQTIYDSSPTLRLKMTGITYTNINEVSIVIGAKGAPPLRPEKDFKLSKEGANDGMILSLLPQRK